MTDTDRPDATLSAGSVDFEALAGSAGSPAAGKRDASEWRAVIIFHPDTARIGELATRPAIRGSLAFGRGSPLFSADTGRAAGPADTADTADSVAANPVTGSRGIDDPHISRSAFCLEPRGKQWALLRNPGSSRLRVEGEEVARELLLDTAQLRSGLVVTLAHRVVLHLRLQDQPEHGRQGGSGEQHRVVKQGLLGVSPAMETLRREVINASQSGDDVLLIGPTGSGKERVARAVHELGSPDAGPWVAVNMAALPADLASASLFGARRGAYTGADADRPGYFLQADGGTLFLDEVGDTPEALQPMLLRALQEREIQVVGGKTRQVTLRVIAAMEKDPDSMAERFRPALRYRLGAQEIRVPALVERAEDVGLLAARVFRERAAARQESWQAHRAEGRVLAAWASCFERLALYHWPGNVRELQHVAARVHGADEMLPRLPPALLERGTVPSAPDRDNPDTVPTVREEHAPQKRLVDLSDEEVAAAWRAAGFEVAAVARELGVSRPAIYRRLQQIDECRLASDVPLAELLAVLDDCRGDLRESAQRLAVSQRGLQARLRASGVRLHKAGRRLAGSATPGGATDSR